MFWTPWAGLGPVPRPPWRHCLRYQLKVALVPAETTNNTAGPQVGRGLLDAWMEPATIRIMRVEVLAPDLLPSPAVPEARDGWKARYKIECISELQRNVQVADRGQVPPVMYGLNGTGIESSARCIKDEDTGAGPLRATTKERQRDGAPLAV